MTRPEKWWITTDMLEDGGEVIVGPFYSPDMARMVRHAIERRDGLNLWIDRDDARRGEVLRELADPYEVAHT